MNNSLTIKALKVSQPIGDFYIAVIDSHSLVTISKADVRCMEKNIDDYIGIQRRISTTRVTEISQYVKNEDATFPTSIVIAIEEEDCRWDESKNEITIEPSSGKSIENIAHILDGQHRIEGLKDLNITKKFELNVTIFVGADIATQAMIFATVNLAQTKVNRSLVYDLFSYEKNRSPQKTAHDIAIVLDKYEASPLHGRIKRLGVKTPGKDSEILTQAAVVESILPLISKNANEDRNIFMKRLRIPLAESDELKKYIFRNIWLSENDDEIAKILINYFNAVNKRWPTAWNDFETKGNVLPKTNGFKALMKFFKPVYLDLVGDKIGSIPSSDEFAKYFAKVNLKDNDFNITTFPPGTSGESGLYKILYEVNFS